MKNKIGEYLFTILLASLLLLVILNIIFSTHIYGIRFPRVSIILQIFQILIILALFIFTLRNTKEAMLASQSLINFLKTNNRKFLFDSGEDQSKIKLEEVRNVFFDNLQKITSFVKQLSSGEYDAKWDKMNDENKHLNTENLAGELSGLQQWLKTKKVEDERRFWLNEGLTQFSVLVRNNQDNSKRMYELAIRFLVKYLNFQQGSVFILNNDGDSFLELMACYAFDRIKFAEKRINIGEGLVGQAFLEGEATLLLEVPNGYTSITSGLGDSSPKFIAIIPMQYNGITEGVLEFAGFTSLETHEIEFLEKSGTFFASAILNSRSGNRMKVLLEEAQKKSLELQAQEEEARQNMEELEAIQENLSRRNKEMEKMQFELNQTSTLLESLLESADDRIYFKDEKSRFLRVSKSFLQIAKIDNVNELIGKSDFDFKSDQEARPKYEAEQEIIRTGSPLKLEEKDTLNDGSVSYISTSKFPLKDTFGKTVGTFGISRDITPLKKTVLEIDLLKNEWQAEKEKLIKDLEDCKKKKK